MGYWGVKSYENDEAADAIDAAMEEISGALYEELMDDRNPLTFDQVQNRLADERTLAAAIARLEQEFGPAGEDWDDEVKLGYVGIVVRHVEFGVTASAEARTRAIEWLRNESIEWDQPTLRKLRLGKEIGMLEKQNAK